MDDPNLYNLASRLREADPETEYQVANAKHCLIAKLYRQEIPSLYAYDGDVAEVGSTQVAPGDYKVEWTGTGDNVQVNILKGKNVVATTEGKVVELPKKAENSSVTTRALDNNTRALMEIQFDNRTESLVFNQSGTTSGE